jgi:hypothetical protein
MLPTGPLVSVVLDFISSLASFSSCRRVLMLCLTPQEVSVSAVKSELPTPRSRVLARAAQQRERERVACRRERGARHQERRSEEFRLCEQQGLSSPGTEEYSSSDEEEEEEEEEEVREQVLPDKWEPAPPSPEPAPVAGVASPGAGAEAPATKQSATEAARDAEAPARVAEMVGGAAAAAPAAPATSAGTSRKRKRAFSSLR